MNPESTIELDVRPLLATGEEPFQIIMETAARVPDAGTLVLTAPFEPIPLYAVMAGRGFAHATEPLNGGDYRVRFVRLAITDDVTVADVYERYPPTAAVFAEHGIDLCCGGSQTVAQAAQAHGVEPAALLAALQHAAMSPRTT